MIENTEPNTVAGSQCFNIGDEERTLVMWHGEFAARVVVTLTAQADEHVRPYVIITFGTPDAVTSIEVDVFKGARVTVPGSSFVRVGGVATAHMGLVGTATIQATLGFGWRSQRRALL